MGRIPDPRRWRLSLGPALPSPGFRGRHERIPSHAPVAHAVLGKDVPNRHRNRPGCVCFFHRQERETDQKQAQTLPLHDHDVPHGQYIASAIYRAAGEELELEGVVVVCCGCGLALALVCPFITKPRLLFTSGGIVGIIDHFLFRFRISETVR